jgi:hypothetical protein
MQFFLVVNQAFGMIGPVLGSFPTERSIVVRERNAKSYRMSAYYMAKLTSELPVVCVLPIIFGSIAYPALRLQQNVVKFVTFLVRDVSHSWYVTWLSRGHVTWLSRGHVTWLSRGHVTWLSRGHVLQALCVYLHARECQDERVPGIMFMLTMMLQMRHTYP